jgi:hypothetical protein
MLLEEILIKYKFMKIACVILGTRGDVQPMVALAEGIRYLLLNFSIIQNCTVDTHGRASLHIISRYRNS